MIRSPVSFVTDEIAAVVADGELQRQFAAPVDLRIVQCALKEANANCVMGHRRQFLAELVVATIVADGAEGNTCCSVSHCAVRLSDPSQLA